MTETNSQKTIRKISDFEFLFQDSPIPCAVTLDKGVIYNLVLVDQTEQMNDMLVPDFLMIELAQIQDQRDLLRQQGIENPKAMPVLTLIFNMSGQEWKSSRDIQDFYPEWLKQLNKVPIEYTLTILDDQTKDEDIAHFDADIQTLIKLAQLQKDSEKQLDWVKEQKEFFLNLDQPVKDFVEQILNQSVDSICSESEKEKRESLNDYEKGVLDGEEKRLNQIVQRLNSLGYSLEEMKTITDLSHSQLIERVDQFKETV